MSEWKETEFGKIPSDWKLIKSNEFWELDRVKPNTLNGVSRTGKTEYAAHLKRLISHTLVEG